MYKEKSFQQWPFRRTEVKEIVNTVIGGQKKPITPKTRFSEHGCQNLFVH